MGAPGIVRAKSLCTEKLPQPYSDSAQWETLPDDDDDVTGDPMKL